MSFLERFKGRTNQLTKEGIISTVTNASTPICKKVEPNRSQSFASPQKENHVLATPKMKKTFVNEEDLEVEDVGMTSPKTNPKSLRLRTSEEHYFHEHNKAPEGSLYDRRLNGQYYMPNPSTKNRELVQTFSAPRSKNPYKFIQEAQSFGDVSMSAIQSPNYSRSNTFGISDQSNNLKFKSLFNYSANYPSPYENSYNQVTPSEKLSEGSSRLSKFSFVERQEQMIAKYKARPEDSPYKMSGSNYSPEKSAKRALYY